MNANPGGSSSYDYDNTTGTTSSDLTKVLIGALAGAAIGSLVAGAFTQKGIEIRNRVGEGSQDIANNLKDKFSDLKGVISDKYDAAKEGAADLFEKGKQKVGLSSGKTDYASDTAYSAGTDYFNDEESDYGPSGSNILLGALIVSVAGTIVWSFASDRGNQTRRSIAKSSKKIASNLKDTVSDMAGSVANTISDTYQTAKEGVADMIEKEKQKSDTSSGNIAGTGSTGADKW